MNESDNKDFSLLENQDILNQIYQKSKIPIAFFGIEGNLIHCNKAFKKILNISKVANFMNDRFFAELIAPNIDNEYFRNKKSFSFEIKIKQNHFHHDSVLKSKHKKNKYLEVKISLIKSEQDDKTFYFIELNDITEKRLIQKELKYNKKRFHIIADNSKEAIFIVDDNFKFSYVNDKVSDISGYSKLELIGEDFRDILEDESKKIVIDRYIRRQKGERVNPQYEFKIITKSGEIRTLEITAIATEELGGGIKSLGQAIDITDKKQTERKLEETEERFEILGKHKLMSVIIIQDKQIKYANKHFQNSFGYSDTRGKNLNLGNFIKRIHPDDKELVLDQLNENFKDDQEKTKNYQFRAYSKENELNWKIAYSNRIKHKGKDASMITLIDITDQKEAELALKKSEKEKSLMVNSISEHFVLQDLDHRVLFANKAAKESLSPSKLDIEGKKCYTLWNDLNEPCPGCPTEESLKNGKIAENEINTPDGRSWYIKGFPVRNEDEEIIGVVEVTRDITDTKNAQKALMDSEQKFRIITEQSFMGIAIVQDYQIKYVNKRFSEILGYNIEEITNWDTKQHYDIIHPEDLKKVEPIFEMRYKGEIEAIKNLQFRITSEGDEVVWVEIFSKTIPYKGGMADLLLLIDITNQKEAEKQLKTSEEKFRKIVNSIPDLFFLLSEDSTVLEYKTETEMLYVKPEEFINKRLAKFLPKTLAIKTEKLIQKTLSTKKPQMMEYSLPIDNKTQHYEARFFHYSTDQVAVFIRNITDRKTAEKMIKEEVTRLKELDQMRKDLISRISHELKTPIMAISGAVEFILDYSRHNMSKEIVELIEMVQINEKRLEKLIESLLDISRMEYGKIQLKKQEYDPNRLIKDSVKELEYLLNKRNLTLELDLTPDIRLSIDKIRIEQVLINILSNAIKNTPPNGKITISTEKRNKMVEISFTDTGIGLTEEEMNKIFTQFGKIERYGKGFEYLDIRGSGLGLYISREIIKMHEGKIYAKSNGRNEGSTFIIQLPLKSE